MDGVHHARRRDNPFRLLCIERSRRSRALLIDQHHMISVQVGIHHAGGGKDFCVGAYRQAIEAAQLLDCRHGLCFAGHEKAAHAVLDQLRHAAAPVGDHGRAAGHRLHDGQAEWFVEVDEVQQAERAAQQPVALDGICRADIADVGREVGFDLALEVVLIPNP